MKKNSEVGRAAQAEQKKALERERHAQAERERVAQAKREREHRKKLIGRAGKITGVLITLFGLYAGVVGLVINFQTRISISSDSAIDPANIFTAPFTVSNDGSFDLHNVSSRCIPIKVLSPSTGATIVSPGPPYPEKLGGMQYPSMSIDLLPPTGKHTFTCPMPFVKTGITSADIIISVSYRPSWWLWEYQVHKRFMTAHGDDKPTKWYEEPMPK
jgi:hypothetical protein